MVDQMILKAQKWVNATYGSVSGYNRCAEDGSTGWQTIYSLTRALQHELGVTALSDSFGPTTLRLLTAYGVVGISSGNTKMRIIAEAALYCKGYSGGNVDGSFDVPTQSGLTALNSDMGLNPPTVIVDVTPKVFKALLTMDAYVLVGKGTAPIRTAQQWLNRAYVGRGQFFIGPCDGVFSRNVQMALVLAIQYELGMTDSQVTGAIGPATKTGLQSAAAHVTTTSGSATWIRLFQTAVACNRYANAWGDSGGVFTEALARSVRAFQEFCKLAQNSEGDYRTWMSLLVSTGDPDRPGHAMDVMYPLNSTTIATVKNLGYQYVGRYLTGGTNKVLTNSEIALIFDNDMAFFPIYQEYGTGVQYFSYDLGHSAGLAACAAAKGFGIPDGTVIYFSVDYDAIDTEITTYLVPHFRGIVAAVSGNATNYAVGVYGCRNVCIRLADAGLTSRSFVSGMSIGYSGNLGFSLPGNWAFDQIQNYTVASGSGTLELDKDVASGRDLGVNKVSRPRDPNDTFYTYLIWLEARAQQYRDLGNTRYSRAELVGQWLRLLDPVNNLVELGIHISDQVFGEYDQGYLDFVKGYAGMPDLLPPRDPAFLWDSDPAHFGASFGGVVTHGFPPETTKAGVADFGSWGGDLVSVLGQCYQAGIGESQTYAYAKDLIATTAGNSYFDRKDFFADVDAFVLGTEVRSDDSLLLSTLFKSHYANAGAAKQRFDTFFSLRFDGSYDTMRAAAESMFGVMVGAAGSNIRDAFWTKDFGWQSGSTSPSDVSAGVRAEVIRAWMSCVAAFASS